jgi:hypothetical protein
MLKARTVPRYIECIRPELVGDVREYPCIVGIHKIDEP